MTHADLTDAVRAAETLAPTTAERHGTYARRGTRCAHGVVLGATCPECVLALWESTPRGPAPRRLREEIRRDERLERQADAQADTSDWSLDDEHPIPRVIPRTRRVA